MSAWVYLQSETPSENPPNGLYTVGHYDPRTGKWIAESDHNTNRTGKRRG